MVSKLAEASKYPLPVASALLPATRHLISHEAQISPQSREYCPGISPLQSNFSQVYSFE